MKSRRRLERAYPFSAATINADTMFRRIKVAAVSLRPKKWDKAHNADKLESFFRKAARRKPGLIVATEGALEGYVFHDAMWLRERVAALMGIAEPLDGPYIARFRKLARTLKTCLSFGFAERRGDEVFNAVVFIDHAGRIRGTYHKTTECTHPNWKFARHGSTIRAFDTPLGRCGPEVAEQKQATALPAEGNPQRQRVPEATAIELGRERLMLARRCPVGERSVRF